MIISSKNIPKYFHSLKFPVEILSEKGKDIVFIVRREELLALCDVCCVIAIGTYNRIKLFRVNRPIESLQNLRVKICHNIQSCEDSKTVFLDVKTYRHHAKRSGAYAPQVRADTV